MSPAEIRFGVPSDLEFIMALEKASLALPWPAEAVGRLLEDPSGVKSSGASFAFACVMPSAGYVGVTGVLDEAEIGNLVVDESCRRKGVGLALMNFAIDELKRRGVISIFLEVESDNIGAYEVYKKLGFVEYGRRADYYGAGRDAVLMKLLVE